MCDVPGQSHLEDKKPNVNVSRTQKKKIPSSSCCIKKKKRVFFPQKPNVDSEDPFFKIPSHQACAIYESERFIELSLCMNHRQLLIIALSNAVTFMASQTVA